MEGYLYGCEECGVVIVMHQDRGEIYYVDRCSGCNNIGRFYERIIVAQESNRYKESHLYVNKEPFVVGGAEEKKDDSKEEE